MSETSKNDRAGDVMGLRDGGIAIDLPCELGYHCPVCEYDHFIDGDECGDYDERLYWSEYNSFIWCEVCNKDYPSALCLQPDDIDKAIDVFLDSVEGVVARRAINLTPQSPQLARPPFNEISIAPLQISRAIHPSRYELLFDDDAGKGVYVDRYRYSAGTNGWAITSSGAYLGKHPNTNDEWFVFTFDIPLTDSEDFSVNYLWNTAEDAVAFWNANRARIIVTSKERLFLQEVMGVGR